MAVRLRRTALCLLLALASCKPVSAPARDFSAERERMVQEQIAMRGVTDARVLAAMRKVPRDAFVPEAVRDLSYTDQPLPIGYDQTISQPYIVALMTEKLRVKPTDRVLEIGTGSGYQAAILGELAAEVYTIEIVEPLGKRAAATLQRLGYKNVHVKIGDGYQGLAGARAIRRDDRDLRTRSRAAAADRADEGRRAHHHPGGFSGDSESLPVREERRPTRATDGLAGALRADDGQGDASEA